MSKRTNDGFVDEGGKWNGWLVHCAKKVDSSGTQATGSPGSSVCEGLVSPKEKQGNKEGRRGRMKKSRKVPGSCTLFCFFFTDFVCLSRK